VAGDAVYELDYEVPVDAAATLEVSATLAPSKSRPERLAVLEAPPVRAVRWPHTERERSHDADHSSADRPPPIACMLRTLRSTRSVELFGKGRAP
jgi:hypothetical protein